MSNQDQYLKLWQQKRNELQVDANVQNDWSVMQHLLNTHMPVVEPAVSGTNFGTQLLSHLIKFKLLYVMAALLAAAAITYVAWQNSAAIKNNRPDKIEVRKDSVTNDSLLTTPADTASNNIEMQSDTLADGTLVAPAPANPSPVNNGTKPGNANGPNAVAPKKNTTDIPIDKIGNVNSINTDANNTAAKNSTVKSTLNASATEKNRANLSVNKPGVNGTSANNTVAKNSIVKLNNKLVSNNPIGTRNTGNITRNRTGANRTGNLASGAAINGIGLVNRRGRGNLHTNGSIANLNNPINGRRVQRNTFGPGPLQSRTAPGNVIPDLMIFSRTQDIPLLSQYWATPFNFAWDSNNLSNNGAAVFTINNSSVMVSSNNRASQPAVDKKANANKPAKTKDKTTTTSNLDWGILLGVNSPGSFTPKNQNKNIYGSLPVDGYTGLFATYNFSNKWAVDMQVKLLVPAIVSGSYNHTYVTKGDTGQTLKQTYKINDSRKIYSAQVPVYLVYKVFNNINVKAGPVINLPIKQFKGANSINIASGLIDTTGYLSRLADTVNATNFEKKIGLGLSGGVGINIKRLRLEATYYRSLQLQKISSPLGNYSSNTNSVQISLGFKLNKTKP